MAFRGATNVLWMTKDLFLWNLSSSSSSDLPPETNAKIKTVSPVCNRLGRVDSGKTSVSDSSRLLSLLHQHSAWNLQDWYSSDEEQLRLGFQRGCLAGILNSKCVVTSGENCGELVEWHRKAYYSLSMVKFPPVTLIFEA